MTNITSQPSSILVVDDTPANLRLLVDLLKENGYQVRPVPNGNLALAAALARVPDLILLDIMMPEIDGYEVCRRLKAQEKTKDIPVIFISAINEVLDKVKAFGVGGVDYITKPFQVEEVLARVSCHLAIRLLQKSLEVKNVALVLSDYIMPDVKGDEVLKRIHEISPNTLTIMLTGQADLEAISRAIKDAKLYRYIAKPWHPEDLKITVIEAIHSYLQDKKLLEQNLKLQAINEQLKILTLEQAQIIAERTAELREANDELRRLANIDGLTDIPNRRFLDKFLHQQWHRLIYKQQPLSIIMIDVDDFKTYNDYYGHLQGLEIIDLKIPHVASLVTQLVTISLGVSTLVPQKKLRPDLLIDAADRALFAAKRQGRNCVVFQPFNFVEPSYSI